MQRRRTALLILCILLLLFGVGVLWMRSEQRQYALNRQLIAALIQGDDKQAIALVQSGANPNTHYVAPPAPTLKQLLSQLFHRSPPPANNSPTAFLIACGARWDDDPNTSLQQQRRSDNGLLIRVMLAHGANIKQRNVDGDTALLLAISFNRSGMVDSLLKAGAEVNTQGAGGLTPLCDALQHDYDTDIAEQLLAHGADPNIPTDVGDNALAMARREQHTDFVRLLIQHGAKDRPRPITSVPTIARLLGVRVGFNGQDVLTHQFGQGKHTTGGHPGGRKLWYTRFPSGAIETDGVNYNDEGLVLESLSWRIDTTTDPTIPLIRHLPQHAGWLGVIEPGMSMAQVSQLTAGKLPAPEQDGNTWTWTAKGFVRPSPVNADVYTTWTAKLTFEKGVLDSIDLDCGGGALPP